MTDYNKLKVTELRDLLKERGIPSTGLTRKQQIVEALEAQDANATANDDGDDNQVSEGIEVSGDGEVEQSEQQENGEAGAAVKDVAEKAEVAVEVTGEGDKSEAQDAEGNAMEGIQEGSEAVLGVGDVSVPVEDQGKDAMQNDDPPTVLEADVPIPNEVVDHITPTQDLSVDEPTSESRKRKRPSPTPSLSEETVSKKLRATDDGTAAPIQDVSQNAPIEVESAPDTKVLPSKTSDDVMDITTNANAVNATVNVGSSETSDEGRATKTGGAMEIDRRVAPSQHPATSVLYIRNLMRPLQLPTFRQHLLTLASPSTASPTDTVIRELHLDAFKTHALVAFDSVASASRARVGLHDQAWPNESQRKPLWVDFIPQQKVRSWIDQEVDAGKNRRFEVVYNSSGFGEVEASLQEVPTGAAPVSQPSFSQATPGPGMPNAPSGPRSSRPSQQNVPPPREGTTERLDAVRGHPERASGPKQTTSASFTKLSENFSSTTAKPKIYWQPVSPTLVKKRLEELERQTSRDWRGGRGRPFGTSLDQLKRYTFEGDAVVDGGPDFGGFGRRQGAGGGGRPPNQMGGAGPRSGGRWGRR